jgi:hypothetical protein
VTYSTGPGALGPIGSACYRHRWVTVLVWIAGVAALITLWTRFGAAAQNDFTGSLNTFLDGNITVPLAALAQVRRVAAPVCGG